MNFTIIMSFNYSQDTICFQKTGIYEKDVCTAPIFRSRPKIDVGFLHGGFWKYNTKPSNLFPFDKTSRDDEAEDEHTIKDDVVVATQDIAAGLVRMGILPRIRYLLEVIGLEVVLFSFSYKLESYGTLGSPYS